MLSLAGIPATAGFVAKFYVLAAGIGAASWVLVFALVAGSAIGLFYYLRVIVAMIGRGPEEPSAAAVPSLPIGAGLVLGVVFVVMLGLGIYPSTLQQLIDKTVVGWL